MNKIPNMPNVTHVQILAALLWIASQAVAFGWLKHSPNQEVLSGAATVIAIGLAHADSYLRGKRVIAHAILNQPAVDTSFTATNGVDLVSQPLGA